MKRSWIGFAMLVILLAASLLVTFAMDRIHEPIARDLERAAEYAVQGSGGAARVFAGNARTAWMKWAHFRACFADHTPIEDIEAGFASLEIYSAAGEDAAFAAACGELARQVEAVGEAHGLMWWNVL